MSYVNKLRDLIRWDKGMDETSVHTWAVDLIDRELSTQNITETSEITVLNIEKIFGNYRRYFIFAVDWQTPENDSCFYQVSEEMAFRIRNLTLSSNNFFIN